MGVAIYGALGHVPPRLPTVKFFRPLQSRTNSDIGLYVVSYPEHRCCCLLHEFHNILCVTLKLFSLSFVPLLAPNPGDATGSNSINAALVQHTSARFCALIIAQDSVVSCIPAVL